MNDPCLHTTIAKYDQRDRFYICASCGRKMNGLTFEPLPTDDDLIERASMPVMVLLAIFSLLLVAGVAYGVFSVVL